MGEWGPVCLILALAALALAWFLWFLDNDLREMVHDFHRTFPGRCMICSYWRFGRREGFLPPDAALPRHQCSEAERRRDTTEVG